MAKKHYQDIPRIDFYDLRKNSYCLILSSGKQIFYIFQLSYPSSEAGLSCGNMTKEEANDYYIDNHESIIFSLKLNNNFYDKPYPLAINDIPPKGQMDGNNEFVIYNFINFFKECHMNIEKCISTIKKRMYPKKVKVVDGEEIYYL